MEKLSVFKFLGFAVVVENKAVRFDGDVVNRCRDGRHHGGEEVVILESDFFFIVVIGVIDRKEGGEDGGHHIMNFRTRRHVGVDVGRVMVVCHVEGWTILMVLVVMLKGRLGDHDVMVVMLKDAHSFPGKCEELGGVGG
jgi:hypothetical protein